jgi:adenylosuccinate synthase
MKNQTKAFTICDLGYGDSGKGAITDFLCDALSDPMVVRYNGASQCGHNVVTPDGREHTFSQFGSGTFHPGVKTYYSHHALFNPLNFIIENEHLISVGVEDAIERFQISPNTQIITPYHVAWNRLHERKRGEDRHGSVGEGVGATRLWNQREPKTTLTIRNMAAPSKLDNIRSRLWQNIWVSENNDDPESAVFKDTGSARQISDIYNAVRSQIAVVASKDLHHPGTLIFEGGQGVLLDESYGFHPYTTWTDTTPRNACRLAAKMLDDNEQVTTLGVIRTYMTRHGPGPFPSEIPKMVYSHPELHNTWGPWQGAFRIGALDLVALRYSLDVCQKVRAPITGLAVTHLDTLTDFNPVCVGYRWEGHDRILERIPEHELHDESDVAGRELSLTEPLMKAEPVFDYWSKEQFLDRLQNELGLPVLVESWGPTRKEKTLNLER